MNNFMWLMLGVTSGMGIARITGYYPIDYKDWAPFLVSIAALVCTGIQAHSSKKQVSLSRDHNKLSVMPKVQFEYTADPKEFITIGIINNGLGPAILLDEIILLINGKEYIYHNQDTQNTLKMLCNGIGLEYKPSYLLKNASLPTNKIFNLITFTNSIDSEIYHQNAIELVRETLNFKVHYKSMYGEEFDTKLFESPTTEKLINTVRWIRR